MLCDDKISYEEISKIFERPNNRFQLELQKI